MSNSKELDWDDPNYVDPPLGNQKIRKYYIDQDLRNQQEDIPRVDRKRHTRELTDSKTRSVADEAVSGGGERRRNNFDFIEFIDVPSDRIGRIIGRAGANIQGIQNDYNVRVDINKENGVVHVKGNDHRSVKDAIGYIRKQVNDQEGRGRSESNRDPPREWTNSAYGVGKREKGTFNKYRNPVAEEPENYDEQKTGSNGGVIDWANINKKAETARAHRWAQCPTLTKSFYREQEEVANMTATEVERIRLESNGISVSRVFKQESQAKNDIPNPVWKFEQCFIEYPDLLDEIRKQGFSKPSPIQSQAWPVLLKGEDLIGIAQTGTGKTLAFLLPAMIHTEYQSVPRGQRGGANVLVMAPTRELALQIENEVNKYSFRGMRAVCVYGGGNRNMQISDVEQGAEIIICTPGRLNDLIKANVIDVSTITYLVLDEADRMLDMGFEPQIRKILLDIRPDRQTVMTSATWPAGVRRLAQSYMNNPIQVCVGSLDLAATHTVKQIVEIMDDGDKFYQIKNFVQNMRPNDKIIVFCGKKSRADDLSSDLTLDGFLCQAIHGNRDQSDREQAIADIKSGEVRILIATDVASRGLDIEDITHVINYDFPRNIEEYVHRVGRTGRAGRTGTSISYVTRSDWGVANELIDILEEAGQEVPNDLVNMASRFKLMKERRAGEIPRQDKSGPRRGRY